MSHDRKPGKMRVVGSAGDTSERRRAGPEPGAPSSMASDVIAIVPDAGTKASGRLLAILFVAGCALGGAALPLVRTL